MLNNVLCYIFIYVVKKNIVTFRDSMLLGLIVKNKLTPCKFLILYLAGFEPAMSLETDYESGAFGRLAIDT